MDILKKLLVKNLLLLIAMLLAVIYSRSLFHSGLLPTHDGEYHVIRFFEFDRTFRDGSFYPRWAPDLNNGFGVPLFNYVYPLPNYVALTFHSIGFSFIDSFKLNLLFATVLGSFFSYLWAKEFWGKFGGFAASVFYTFSPYHSLDIFIRGSVGEVWALALFPAFLWSITKVIRENKSQYIFVSTIFLILIIFSHNILAFMFFFFAFAYVIFLFLNSKRTSLPSLLAVFILALGISSIFWAPAIFERQYVRGLEIYDYTKNFPDLYQLLIPSWGSGFSSGLLQNQLSLQIGLANLIVIVCSAFLIFKKFKEKNIVIFFIICFFIIFFLMLKLSTPIWNTVPFMNYFQFPWRLLSLEILFVSFIAGSLVNLPKFKILMPLLVVLCVVLGLGYTNIAYYLERNDSYYTKRSNFIDGTNSPGNSFNTIWMRSLEKRKEKIFFSKGEGEIKDLESKSASHSFKASTRENSELVANLAYFPGWTVYVDNKVQKSNISENGLFSFPVSQGEHNIKIRLENTLVRSFSQIISFISLLILLIYTRFARIRR